MEPIGGRETSPDDGGVSKETRATGHKSLTSLSDELKAAAAGGVIGPLPPPDNGREHGNPGVIPPNPVMGDRPVGGGVGSHREHTTSPSYQFVSKPASVVQEPPENPVSLTTIMLSMQQQVERIAIGQQEDRRKREFAENSAMEAIQRIEFRLAAVEARVDGTSVAPSPRNSVASITRSAFEARDMERRQLGNYTFPPIPQFTAEQTQTFNFALREIASPRKEHETEEDWRVRRHQSKTQKELLAQNLLLPAAVRRAVENMALTGDEGSRSPRPPAGPSGSGRLPEGSRSPRPPIGPSGSGRVPNPPANPDKGKQREIPAIPIPRGRATPNGGKVGQPSGNLTQQEVGAGVGNHSTPRRSNGPSRQSRHTLLPQGGTGGQSQKSGPAAPAYAAILQGYQDDSGDRKTSNPPVKQEDPGMLMIDPPSDQQKRRSSFERFGVIHPSRRPFMMLSPVELGQYGNKTAVRDWVATVPDPALQQPEPRKAFGPAPVLLMNSPSPVPGQAPGTRQPAPAPAPLMSQSGYQRAQTEQITEEVGQDDQPQEERIPQPTFVASQTSGLKKPIATERAGTLRPVKNEDPFVPAPRFVSQIRERPNNGQGTATVILDGEVEWPDLPERLEDLWIPPELSSFDARAEEKIVHFLWAKIYSQDVANFALLKNAVTASRYEGTDDSDVFWRWLGDLVRAFRSLRLVGLGGDQSRVDLMASYLGPMPKEWYDDHITANTALNRNWNSLYAILGLFKQCVTPLSALKAKLAFDSCTMGPHQTVEQFRSKLEKLADKLPHEPTPYELCGKFLAGLPEMLRRKLILYNGISAERSTLSEMVEAATKTVQQNFMVNFFSVHDRKSSIKRTPGSTEPAVRSSTPQPSSGGARRTHVRFAQQTPPKPRPAQPSAGSSRPAASAPKPAVATSSQPQAKADRSKVICHGCGQRGHFRNDPVCPKYGASKVQLRTQEVVDEAADEENEGVELPAAIIEDDLTQDVGQMYDTAFIDDYGGVLVGDQQEEDTGPEEYEQFFYGPGEEEEEEEEPEASDGLMMQVMNLSPLKVEQEDKIQMARMISESRTPEIDANLYDLRLSKEGSSNQPNRQPLVNHVLTTMLNVNGHSAYTLLDSGSNTDAISFEFAAAHRIPVFDLEQPMVLQLGVKHSRAMITRGARIKIEGPAGTAHDHYVDVINIGGYDMVIGTPFMTKYQVMLDLAKRSYIMNGRRVQCLDPVRDRPPKPVNKGKLRPLKASDDDPALVAKLRNTS